MNRNKKIGTTLGIITLLIASLIIGAFYLPYGRIATPYYEAATPALAPGKEILVQRTGGDSVDQEKMVIYNAYISLETEDIGDTLAKIRILAENYGGYVASSSRSARGQQDRAEMTIRIPKDSFQLIVLEIGSYGELLDERTTSEDITEQYIDLKARLNNLQKQETRLYEIMEMAITVEDILEVEKELTRIRSEIERLQGQLNYLERNVEMSLISVSLIEPLPPFTPPGMDWSQTVETALIGLFAVVRGLIILTVSLLPLIVIGATVYYVFKRLEQKKKKKK